MPSRGEKVNQVTYQQRLLQLVGPLPPFLIVIQTDLLSVLLGPSKRLSPVGSASGARPRVKTPAGGARVSATNMELLAAQNTISEMTTQMEGLEKERDFYFAKLRDIEILVQQEMESPEHTSGGREDEVLKEIQKILYSTEVSFASFYAIGAGNDRAR